MQIDDFLSATDASLLYAGYAQAFRYPQSDDGVLTPSEYMAAFDQAASSSALSVRESSYVDHDSSGLFEELVRYYEHFGLRRNEDADLPDHIGVELEFMHFLCELERHAESENASSVRSAQRDFIDRHVRRLVGGLSQRMLGRSGRAAELVHSCSEFVEAHRRALSDGAR